VVRHRAVVDGVTNRAGRASLRFVGRRLPPGVRAGL
jgi:hypothetical protein